jgi:hypothetical protein
MCRREHNGIGTSTGCSIGQCNRIAVTRGEVSESLSFTLTVDGAVTKGSTERVTVAEPVRLSPEFDRVITSEAHLEYPVAGSEFQSIDGCVQIGQRSFDGQRAAERQRRRPVPRDGQVRGRPQTQRAMADGESHCSAVPLGSATLMPLPPVKSNGVAELTVTLDGAVIVGGSSLVIETVGERKSG